MSCRVLKDRSTLYSSRYSWSVAESSLSLNGRSFFISARARSISPSAKETDSAWKYVIFRCHLSSSMLPLNRSNTVAKSSSIDVALYAAINPSTKSDMAARSSCSSFSPASGSRCMSRRVCCRCQIEYRVSRARFFASNSAGDNESTRLLSTWAIFSLQHLPNSIPEPQRQEASGRGICRSKNSLMDDLSITISFPINCLCSQ
ncbi:hypothetical protein FB599_0048 [Herbaspirillum sp. SJZ130]|nr:hypothetical protein FB598_4102 [Herbaspirillum sp. SJZ106]TQK14660.1 hypothetical protein FB599_0048 [Herbaspirillum sp. SJZ130]